MGVSEIVDNPKKWSCIKCNYCGKLEINFCGYLPLAPAAVTGESLTDSTTLLVCVGGDQWSMTTTNGNDSCNKR